MASGVLSVKLPGLSTEGKSRSISLSKLAVLPDEEAIVLVKHGLVAQLARQLAERLEVPLDSLVGPLQLNLRTLHRRMQQGTLAQPESERLLAITRIFFQCVHVLGTEEKAAHWLQSRPRVFMGKTPLECMETWLGIRQVETALGRIEGGVYS